MLVMYMATHSGSTLQFSVELCSRRDSHVGAGSAQNLQFSVELCYDAADQRGVVYVAYNSLLSYVIGHRGLAPAYPQVHALTILC